MAKGTDYIRTESADRNPHIERGSKLTNAGFEYITINTMLENTTSTGDVQGYYSLLSNYYFTGGVATDMVIDGNNINTWVDVLLTPDAQGVFDKRVVSMKEASDVGHTGTGAAGSPLMIQLVGLTDHAHGSVRAALSFEPEVDEGRLESRVLFTRHSTATPSTDFSIEETTLNMDSGAAIDYVASPNIAFFLGDTISTNVDGEAGTLRFQVKLDVQGILSMREVTFFIQS
tara:strand:- start:4 stop:693 length:690 start_codon:yes stop_codon:yes gene_type:complete